MSYIDEQRLKMGELTTKADWLKVGIEASREVDRLRAEVESLKADRELLNEFEKIRSDDVESHQISEDEASHELRGHYWTTINVQSCDVRVGIQATIDAARAAREGGK